MILSPNISQYPLPTFWMHSPLVPKIAPFKTPSPSMPCSPSPSPVLFSIPSSIRCKIYLPTKTSLPSSRYSHCSPPSPRYYPRSFPTKKSQASFCQRMTMSSPLSTPSSSICSCARTPIRILSNAEQIQHTLTVYFRIKQPTSCYSWFITKTDDFKDGSITICQNFMNQSAIK